MNRTIRILVLSLLCASPLLAKQEICVKGPMGRDYFLYLPDKIDPAKTYWLVVGVHGHRGSGRGGSGVAGWPDRYDCIAVAPSFPEGYQDLEKQTDLQLLQIFSELQGKYRLHPKLFVTGHSGGSQFSHRFASHHPDQTLACAASSGGTWDAGGGSVAFSPAAKTIPIAISCGDKDAERYEGAKRFEKYLSDGGYFFKAKYWPGAGHGGYGPGIEQLRNEAFSLGTSGLIGQGAKERDEALKKINQLVESGDLTGASSAMKSACDAIQRRDIKQYAADLQANGWQGGDAAAAECARRCAQFWADQSADLTRRIAARGKASSAEDTLPVERSRSIHCARQDTNPPSPEGTAASPAPDNDGGQAKAKGLVVTSTEGQVYNAESVRRDTGKIYFKIPSPTGKGSMEMGLPVIRIATISFPEPPELALARQAAEKGNAVKVLELTGPFVTSQAQYKDVNGSWWPQMAKLRILALASCKKDEETADLSREMGSLRTPEALSIARGGTLFASLKSGDVQAVTVGAKALPLFGGDAGSPLAQLALGRALLSKKDYAGAIRAFLSIKVFYPSVSLLQPPAIQGSIDCYMGLQDPRRMAARNDLMKDWPESPQGEEMAKAQAAAKAKAQAASGSASPAAHKPATPKASP